jgi:hypothetical protein
LAQSFTGVMAVMTLLLATVVEEHMSTAEQIRELGDARLTHSAC